MAQGYLARKIFKSVYLSLFMNTELFLKSESLIFFKLNLFMVAIGKQIQFKKILDWNFPPTMLAKTTNNVYI